MENKNFYHESVLLYECIDNLAIKADGYYVDATFGGGGHSKEILKKLGENGKLIAFDQDKDAIQNLPNDKRVLFINENFKYIHRFLRLYNIEKVDGILADLGVSSFQFDSAKRGFSIRFDGELDMRMYSRIKLKAKDIIAKYSEKELHKLFEKFGEVTNAKTLAQTIVQKRASIKINSIEEFKLLINSCIIGNPNKYLAQVFQALRIEVNAELKVLEDFMQNCIKSLKPGGRLCVISFHSLEDRIVKNSMKGEIDKNESYNPYAQNAVVKTLKIISNKPITPSEQELKRNSRARSAKLRVAEKI